MSRRPVCQARAATRARRNPERGAIAVLAGILLTTLLGFAALGFDLAYTRLAREELQNAIDAASHAAANALRISDNVSTALYEGKDIAKANTIFGKPLTLVDGDFTFGGWNFFSKTFTAGGNPPNAVRIKSLTLQSDSNGGYIKLSFGRGLGFSEKDTTKPTLTAFRKRNIMLEFDVTGSFLTSKGGSSEDINRAVAANIAFLDTLHAFHFASDAIGLDTFTGRGAAIVNWTPIGSLEANYSTTRSLWFGDGVRSDNPAKTAGLAVCHKAGVDPAWPNHTYAKIQSCSDGGEPGFFAGTNIGAAIRAGTDKLVAKTVASPWETRILVVLTDGGPMCCQAAGGGGLESWRAPTRCGDGAPHVAALGDPMQNYCSDTTPVCLCARGLATDGIAQADYAATKNVIVYTIAFGSYAPRLRYAASLIRNGGTAEQTADSTKLEGILKKIAGTIPVSIAY